MWFLLRFIIRFVSLNTEVKPKKIFHLVHFLSSLYIFLYHLTTFLISDKNIKYFLYNIQPFFLSVFYIMYIFISLNSFLFIQLLVNILYSSHILFVIIFADCCFCFLFYLFYFIIFFATYVICYFVIKDIW